MYRDRDNEFGNSSRRMWRPCRRRWRWWPACSSWWRTRAIWRSCNGRNGRPRAGSRRWSRPPSVRRLPPDTRRTPSTFDPSSTACHTHKRDCRPMRGRQSAPPRISTRGVNHGVEGSWPLPLKICRRGRSMLWPHKMSHSSIQNCCWVTLQVSHHEGWKMCQKWKVELIFRGDWNSITWPDWLRPTYFTTDLRHWSK